MLIASALEKEKNSEIQSVCIDTFLNLYSENRKQEEHFCFENVTNINSHFLFVAPQVRTSRVTVETKQVVSITYTVGYYGK